MPVLGKRESIAVEYVADAVDGGQLATERELATQSLDRDAALFRDVKVALRRIEDETYGTCLRCDQEIKLRRLEVLPWAAYCVACQEVLDRERGHLDKDPVVARALL